MEEEHSIINNSNDIVQITPSSNSHRLQIRRGILRETTTLRTSPYNSTLSNLRRRQNSLITSQTINNLITNIENTNNNIQTDVNISSNDQDETEIISNHFLVTSDNENNHEDFQVLADLSNTSPIDLTIANENNNSNESYHSLSTIDFDPDDDDDDDEHHYYYTSTSIPIFDYSSSPEPLIVHNHPIDITQYQYDDEYSSSINNNNLNDDEDLSIEIILESSQNNSLSPISRRRHSIIPSNSRGLRLSDILSIPQKLYSSFKQQINDKYHHNTQCCICLEDFQLIDSIKILNCQHIFHSGCINEWLRTHSNCPYCRTSIVIETSRTTTGRRQRTRTRRNLTRSSTNNSSQQNSIDSSTFEQQQQP